MINIINENELLKITGGGISSAWVIAIGAAVAIIAGFLDGFTRPFNCR